jgi:hypothetical protein
MATRKEMAKRAAYATLDRWLKYQDLPVGNFESKTFVFYNIKRDVFVSVLCERFDDPGAEGTGDKFSSKRAENYTRETRGDTAPSSSKEVD